MDYRLLKQVKQKFHIPLIFFLFLIPSNTIKAQSPYYDAIYLSTLEIDPIDFTISLDNKGLEIINNYLRPKRERTKTEVELEWDSLSNPFFGITLGEESAYESTLFGNVEEGIESVGGLNVTNVADGLAKFLVQRAKQELSITFFSNFKEVLEDNDGFSLLFPDTYSVLKVIDSEIYQYSHYLNTLREAFEKDLKNVLTNMNPFLGQIKTNRYKANPEDIIAQKIEYFESTLLIVNNIRQGEHPAEAIGKLEFQTYHPNNTVLLNIQENIKLFNIFSNSLRSTDEGRYWITSSQLPSLLDDTTFKIYLGLLYQLHGEKEIFDKPFSDYLDEVKEKPNSIKLYKNYLQDFILETEQITLSIQSIKQKKESGENVDSYQELFQSTINFLKGFEKMQTLDSSFKMDKLNEVVQVLDHSVDIYVDINERRYNTLILDVSKLFTELLGENNFKWNEDLIKYGTFIANVAKAENSDEVQAAIEAIALPVGSATIKKKTKFNVALNAYLGLAGSYEYNGDTADYKYGFGVNAPIGIATSWGHGLKYNEKCSCDKESGSSTIFASLVDIGAVTTFRFNDNNTEELPVITLENIFAPGLYYVYGLPKAPISFGLGGQLGPQLRNLTSEAIELNSNLSYSFKFFIAVDIPLLNFYTKSR